MTKRRIKAVLIGDSDRAAMYGCLGAAGVFGFALALWAVLWGVNRLDVTVPISFPWLIGALAVVTLVPPAVYAYQNRGLLVCLALGSALPLALYLVPTASTTMAPDESVLWGLGAGLMFGIPAGSAGFLIGVGSRRFLHPRRTTSRDGPS